MKLKALNQFKKKYRKKLWRLYNFGTKFHYKELPTSFETCAVANLSKYGWYKTSLDELGITLPEPEFPDETDDGKGKGYITSAWKLRPITYNPNNPFMALSENKTFKTIAGLYLGYKPINDVLRLERVTPTGKLPARSQLWHRDPNDEKILKILIYLSDVDEKNGPFKYLEYSTNHLRNYLPRSSILHETLDQHIHCIKTFTGKRGTVIMADTVGLHCGAYVEDGERKMLTIGYVTKGGGWKRD